MNRWTEILCVSVFFAAVAVGCKSQYDLLLSSADVDAKYKAAFNLYNSGKYKKAAAMFESLAMQTSGTLQDDTVRYYWAMSNYKDKDYVVAKTNFESYIDLYPASTFTQDARFLMLDCMFRSTNRYELDQTPSKLAIMAISEYIMDYPNSDKVPVCRKMLDDLSHRLDQKAFEAARLYYKMEDYIASKTAFKNILKDNAENIYREEILYYIAKSAYKYAQLSVSAKQKARYMDFVDEYFNFVSEVPESVWRKDLDQCYSRAQHAMASTGVRLTRKELNKEAKADRKTERQINKSEK